MDSFFKRLKKSYDFDIDPKLREQIKKIYCLQISQAILQEDIRQRVREEIKSILNEHKKKGWRQIA